jgi:hypothetical protein
MFLPFAEISQPSEQTIALVYSRPALNRTNKLFYRLLERLVRDHREPGGAEAGRKPWCLWAQAFHFSQRLLERIDWLYVGGLVGNLLHTVHVGQYSFICVRV